MQVIYFLKVPNIKGSNIICPPTCAIYAIGFFQNQHKEYGRPIKYLGGPWT